MAILPLALRRGEGTSLRVKIPYKIGGVKSN